MRAALRAAIVIGLSAGYFAGVLHFADGTWKTSGVNGWIDPYFINVILEHWRSSLVHGTNPASPPMYFPATHTLGFSHGLVLYSPFYVLARTWLPPFQAHTIALWLVMTVGTVSLYLLLRRGPKLGSVEAILLTAFFATSLNVVNGEAGAWSQRLSVFTIPLILLLGVTAARMHPGKRRLALACSAGFLFGLLFVQDFPSAMFGVLSATLLLAGAPIVWRSAASAWRGARRLIADRLSQPPTRTAYVIGGLLLAWSVLSRLRWFRRLHIGSWALAANEPMPVLILAALSLAWPAIRRSILARRLVEAIRPLPQPAPVAASGAHRTARRQLAIAFAIGILAGLGVFLWIYLPAIRQHSGFPREELLLWIKLVEPGRWPSVASALESLQPYPSARPFIFAGIVVALAWLPWFGAPASVRWSTLWLAIVSAAVMLMPIRFPGFSLWIAIAAVMPGLAAVRDPSRLIPFFELGAVVFCATWISQLERGSRLRVATLGLAALLIVAMPNATRFDYERPIRVFDRWVMAPIDVDPSCRSFFMKEGSAEYNARSENIWSLYGVDATFIALRYAIPTLNGYSAWAPDGWDLANPRDPAYLERIRRWIDRNRLQNVCQLDVDARTMRPF